MKLDWRQGILYFTAMGMEGCCLYTLMALLNRHAVAGNISVVGTIVLFPVALLFNMFLRRLRWPRVCILSVSWLAWVAAVLLMVKLQLFAAQPLFDTSWLLAIPQSIARLIYTFRPEVLILLSTGIIWWLSRRLASRAANFPMMVSEFQFGIIILVLTFLIASLLKATPDNPIAVTLSFFLFALLGISVAHALERTSWLSGLYQGHWSGLLLISIAVVLLVGLLITWLVTPDLLHLLWEALKWVWWVIWGLIMKVLLFIASLFPELGPSEPPPAPGLPAPEPSETYKLWSMPEWLRSGAQVALGIFWVGLILLALWRVSSNILHWLRFKLAGMAGAEFEPMPGTFKADFLSLLKRIYLKLLSLKLPFRPRQKEGLLPPEVSPARQIYRQLLRWAGAGGYPRSISQTPHEYYFALAGLLPEASEDLNFVTQQYIKARYGALPSAGDELNELNRAWQRVKQIHLKRAATELAHGKEVS
jgi:hypothetical protein